MDPTGHWRHRARAPGNAANIAHRRLNCIRRSHVSYHGCRGCSKGEGRDIARIFEVPTSRATNAREMGHPATNAIEQRRSTWISVAEILPVQAVVGERGC